MSQSPARRARRHNKLHPQHREHQHLWKTRSTREGGWVCIGCGVTVPLDDPQVQR